MTGEGLFTAIVLAGSRPGPGVEPVARAAGVSCKALAEVGGVAMVARVVAALGASSRVGRILVSAHDTAEIGRAVAGGIADGGVEVIEAGATPSTSVVGAIAERPETEQFLVTTADHALLTPEMVDYFCDAARGAGDVAVGLVAKSVLQPAYPEAARTYISFADDGYSGCNMFALLTPLARRAPEFWKRAEHERKKPWRLIRVFGFVNLVLFLARRLDLDAAMARASRVMGMRVGAVRMPFAEAAIDVDKPEHLELANAILKARGA